MEAAELGEALGASRLGCGRPAVEQFAGWFSFSEGGAVDGDREPVAAGVGAAREGVGYRCDRAFAGVGAFGCGGDGAAECLVVPVPRAFEAAEAGDIGVGVCFVEDERVPGRECFDFGERERVVADVVDLAGVEPAAGN
ncbi:MAG: hypothetical protein ACLP0J_03570 [Solirubrobacteraceae bacterium]